MENHFYHIDEKVAEDLIARTEKSGYEKSGANSKASTVGKYVVLKAGNIPLVQTDKFPASVVPFDVVIEKLWQLEKQGGNAVPILGYCFDPEKSRKIFKDGNKTSIRSSYGKGYIIQHRAPGQEMWERERMGEKEYIVRRTKTFADAPQEQFDKFVADYMAILDAGIMVDYSKRENFFYDEEKGFSFIDLNFMLNKKQRESKYNLLSKYCTMPANSFVLASSPAVARMTDAEYHALLDDNRAVFEKCKKAIVANGLATEAEIKMPKIPPRARPVF